VALRCCWDISAVGIGLGRGVQLHLLCVLCSRLDIIEYLALSSGLLIEKLDVHVRIIE